MNHGRDELWTEYGWAMNGMNYNVGWMNYEITGDMDNVSG